MTIRIVRNQDGNCINFVGSSNPAYWNACLSAQVDSEDADRINVINDIRTGGGDPVYEFYKVPYTEFVDADSNPFASAQDCADYITAQAHVVDVTASSYLGIWDADTNTPTLSDGDSPNTGDFYYVSANGSTTLGGVSTWRRGDRVLWNGTVWQKLEATSVVDANTRTTLLDTQTAIFADGEAGTKDPQGAPGWYYSNTANNKINWYFYGDTDVTSYTYGDFGGAYMVVDIRKTGSALFWSLYTKPQLDGSDQAFWYRSRVVYDDYVTMQAQATGRYLVHTSNLDVTGIEPLLPRISLPVDSISTVGLQAGTEEVYLMALSTNSGLQAGQNEFVVEKVAMKLGEYIQAYDLVAVPTTSAAAGATTPTTIDFEREATATTILADDGQQFGVNSIRAIGNGDNTIDVVNAQTNEVIYDNLDMTQIQVEGVSAGATEAAVVNTLNALFFNTPVGDGGSYAPTFPVTGAADITYTLAEGIVPTTEITPGTAHLYARDTDSTGHGARLWSTETIDTAGEYFTVKIIGDGRFIIGFADGTTDSDSSGTADDLEELANNTGSAASGLFWSQAIYDYGTYTAPWTWYGSSSSGAYGPGWNGAQTSMMRYNNTVQTALTAGSGNGVLFKAGIDSQGYLSVWYWDDGRSDDWILCSRRSTGTPGDRNWHLVVKLWDGNTTIVEVPQRVATDPTAPALNYRYIESPDGTFHYPLFATAEEANWVSQDNGGSSASTQQIFVDEPTNTTWYAPQTGYTSTGTSAPSDTASITYTVIDTEADSLHAPSAFTMQDLSVDESATVNYQVSPQGSTNWTTTVSGLPTGLAFDGATVIQGTAPEVTGNNVDNPSDVYTVTVTRTNAYGSTSTTFDITVANLTAPATAVSGFTWDGASSPLVDADTMDDGSVVTLDNTLDEPRRYIFLQSWVEANVLPALRESGDAVWLGVKDGAASLTDGVAASDFDAYIKWEWASASSHTSTISADTTSAQTVNSLTDSFYDYAFEADDAGALHVIACNVNSINSEPGVDYGGGFSRTVSTTGTDPYTLSLATVGTQMDLSTTGVSEIVIPQAPRWIQVHHTQGGHVLEFKQTGDAAFSGTMPTLQAGYTYRFLVNSVYWADQSTNTHLTANDILRFTADGSTEYTTGITRSGTVNDEFAYVEFAVPSDVPPLSWYNDQAGIGSASGISISGSTYVTPVTGVTQEGPAANQTGSNLFDAGDHGWLSVDETLAAGERLVLDTAFLADLVGAMPDNGAVFVGLKDTGWTNGNDWYAGFEGGLHLTILRFSTSDVRMYVEKSGSSSSTYFTSLANITANSVEAFLELDSSGDNIRGGVGPEDADAVAYADWSTSYKNETGDQGYGLATVDVMIQGRALPSNAAGMDTADVDWTGLSEISIPTPSSTLTTSWNKALDFSGGSEYTVTANSSNLYTPLNLGGISTTVAAPTLTGYTSNDTNARPWATAIVFSSDNNSSNQHIWNLGEGAGTTDDNIYLRVDGFRDIYFGWGRSGALNEAYLGRLPGTAGTWNGIYIAHNGTRLSGADATAHNLAACFDIRKVDLSTGAVVTSAVPANWNTNGGRMDRQFAGSMTIGGRGANRNFQGKVASMVVTTLRRNVAMPTNAEISMMVRDPEQWLTDYKVGNDYRSPASGSDTSNFQLGNYDPHHSTQVWLMGDGTSDAYALIRNQVAPTITNRTAMQMLSMVSNDIETVNINGLT